LDAFPLCAFFRGRITARGTTITIITTIIAVINPARHHGRRRLNFRRSGWEAPSVRFKDSIAKQKQVKTRKNRPTEGRVVVIMDYDMQAVQVAQDLAIYQTFADGGWEAK
jgi:hypothetical protein